MDTTSTLSTIAVVVSVAGALFTAVNHSRIRSSCCGKKLEVTFDVDKTSPTPIKARPEV